MGLPGSVFVARILSARPSFLIGIATPDASRTLVDAENLIPLQDAHGCIGGAG